MWSFGKYGVEVKKTNSKSKRILPVNENANPPAMLGRIV
jgi:hypothetical protein